MTLLGWVALAYADGPITLRVTVDAASRPGSVLAEVRRIEEQRLAALGVHAEVRRVRCDGWCLAVGADPSLAEVLTAPGRFEVRPVDEDFDDAALDAGVVAARDALPPDRYADDGALDAWLHAQGRLPDRDTLAWQWSDGARYRPLPVLAAVLDNADLAGVEVVAASPPLPGVPRVDPVEAELARLQGLPPPEPEPVAPPSPTGAALALHLGDPGRERFCLATTRSVGRRIALLLDGEVMSAPNIREPICGGSVRVMPPDARALAAILAAGPLPAAVEVVP